MEKIPQFKSLTADLTMIFSQFRLPPISDVLLIGKRTRIGADSIARAEKLWMRPEIHYMWK